MLAAASLAFPIACGPSVLVRGPAPDEWTRVEARGDWDDLDAALEAASTRAQMAVVRSSPGDAQRAFELVTAGDEPVWLEVLRDPGVGGLVLRCKVGRFGHDSRQGVLLGAMRRRLEQLRGVETAPISW